MLSLTFELVNVTDRGVALVRHTATWTLTSAFATCDTAHLEFRSNCDAVKVK
jgi:hypothetical protein